MSAKEAVEWDQDHDDLYSLDTVTEQFKCGISLQLLSSFLKMNQPVERAGLVLKSLYGS